MHKIFVVFSSLLLLFAPDGCHAFQPLLHRQLGKVQHPQHRAVEIPRSFKDFKDQSLENLQHGTRLFGEGGSDDGEIKASGKQLGSLNDAETEDPPPSFNKYPVKWFKHYYDKDFLQLKKLVEFQRSRNEGVLTLSDLKSVIYAIYGNLCLDLEEANSTKATSITINGGEMNVNDMEEADTTKDISITIGDITMNVVDFQQIQGNFKALLDNDVALKAIAATFIKWMSALEALEELKSTGGTTLQNIEDE